MQLFIPSVITIVIAAVLAFLVIPRTGALILASVSLLALIAVGFHHYNMFYSEYMLSTWQNGIGENAPFFVLGFALLFIIGSLLFMFQGGEGAKGAVNTVQQALAAPLETLSESMENVVNAKPSNANGIAAGLVNQGANAVNAAKNLFAAATAALPGLNVVAPKPSNANAAAKPPNAAKQSPVIPGLGFRASEV